MYIHVHENGLNFLYLQQPHVHKTWSTLDVLPSHSLAERRDFPSPVNLTPLFCVVFQSAN